MCAPVCQVGREYVFPSAIAYTRFAIKNLFMKYFPSLRKIAGNILLASALLLAACSPKYDLLIRNGQVIDGSGSGGFAADVAVKGDRIVKIAPGLNARAAKVIDATGKVVAPGFVDVHAHLEPLPVLPAAESHLRMGVTTAVGGPDGSSPLSIGSYLDSLEKIGVGLNTAYLIGHNAIRLEVLGMENRPPSTEELRHMKALVEKAMQEGAFGLSTGLKYLPGAFAKTSEVVALARVAAKYGGVYTSHIREEGLGLLDAVDEVIQIAEEAGITAVITHHKAIGQPMWGASKTTLARVDSARARGLDVRIDQYPYTASHTGISVLIPAWAMEGGRYKAFAKRCEDPVLRDSIKQGIIYNILNDRGGGDLRRIQFSTFNWKPELAGKTLHDWALSEGLEPTPENGAELIIQAQLHRGANCIFHAMSEEDVVRIMQHPVTMVASDGRITEFGKGHPHPRVYGTFPRVLGRYVREMKVLDLPTAIHKMSGLPAQVFGIPERGLLKEGYFADLVIFNPDTIQDKATFEAPHQYPVGIDFVIVNGKVVLEEGAFYDLRAGKVLRKALLKTR